MKSRIAFTLSFILLTFLTPSAYADLIDIGNKNISAIRLQEKNSTGRVVALANGSAEIIDALGLRTILVGRDIASDLPTLKRIPIVTSGHQIVAEKIIALKPTLVIVDNATGPATALETLRKAKILVVTIPQAWNVEDSYKKITAIAKALDETGRGRELISQMRAVVTKNRGEKAPKVAFLYLRGPSAVYLIGGPGSGADSLITSAGGRDIGAETMENPFNTLTSEALAKANPEILLLMTKGLQSVGGIKGLLKLPGIAQTIAGKKVRIITVDDSLLLSFGPRTPSLIRELSRAIKAESK